MAANLSRRFFMGTGLALAGMPLVAGHAVAQAEGSAQKWVPTWASSQMVPNPDGLIPESHLQNVTIRQVFRVSTGGQKFRLRLSNVHGAKPLRIDEAFIARPVDVLTSQVHTDSLIRLTFSGRNGIVIPPFGEYYTDAFDMNVEALSHLSVSLYLPEVGSPQTGHPGARNTTFFTHGNQVTQAQIGDAQTLERWFYIAGLEVMSDKKASAIVALGDSITDGYGVKPGQDARWTDRLAERLQAGEGTKHLSVLNHGFGGNKVIGYGLGPNAISRFDRDVLGQVGVKHVVLLEGVNDIGVLAQAEKGDPAVAEMITQLTDAYHQMILRTHAHGLKIFGGTILPFEGAGYWNPDTSEVARQALNEWIRTPGHFDAVIDFDKIMADPSRPQRMLPALDCGDHLHPSLEGYAHMGNSIDLSLFT